MSSFKQTIKERFPKAFVALRDIKDQCMVEARTIRQVGLGSIVRHLLSPAPAWEKELPLQTPSGRDLSELSLDKLHLDQFLTSLEQEGIPHSKGAHCVYLPPASWRQSPLAPLAAFYPEDAGIKLSLATGGLEGPYVLKEHSGLTQRKLLPSHSALLITGNYLHAKGLAPRLYDLLELATTQGPVAAHILRHVPGPAPDADSCRTVVEQLKNLTRQGSMELINFNGFEDDDFKCPACNGNLRTDDEGRPLYVDIQNFKVQSYDKHLRHTADKAMATSHFGDKSYILGGRYLYQAVPGLKAYAKRAPAQRMPLLREMLAKAGKSLQSVGIMDIGCNIGLMSAHFLKEGALWVHGWDMPEMVTHTREMLLAVGCTRFSLTGRLLADDADLTTDLPSFITDSATPMAVSYLSVYKHIGWLPTLKDLDWTFMIYEGHENDTPEDTAAILDKLNEMLPVRVLCSDAIADGTSLARPLAIIERLENG